MGIVRIYFHINLINFGPFLPIQKKNHQKHHRNSGSKSPHYYNFFSHFPDLVYSKCSKYCGNYCFQPKNCPGSRDHIDTQ